VSNKTCVGGNGTSYIKELNHGGILLHLVWRKFIRQSLDH